MRVKVDYRTDSKDTYKKFCKSHPIIKLSYSEWRNIIYSYNVMFKEYILETGEKAKLPSGFGEFSIRKQKKKRIVKGRNGEDKINLPIDWSKTLLMGKRIYNFNFHTEGYFFGWVWFRRTALFKLPNLWRFKPTRLTSRLLAHYLHTSDEYRHIYKEWDFKN